MHKDDMTMSQLYTGMALGKGDIFQLALEGSARAYALINIVVLGILFGLSNMLGTIQISPDIPVSGKFAVITPLIFSVSGIVSIFGALIAMTLIYWAAARAFGGPGGLGLSFELIGLAAIPFWILAPLLNYTLRFSSPGSGRLFLFALMIPPFLWSFKVMRQSLISGQGISAIKATIALAAMWIFTVSSIYVFIP